MSESVSPGVEPPDHREQTDWVAISKSHGTNRRIHRVKGDPGPGDLRNGEECEVACATTLIGADSAWRAKPSGVFPPGYHPLCDCPECFGDEESDSDAK